MSKKPYTTKPIGLTAPETCADCKFWREAGDGLGRCGAIPPAFVKKATAFGPLLIHGVTPHDYPACGTAEPR